MMSIVESDTLQRLRTIRKSILLHWYHSWRLSTFSSIKSFMLKITMLFFLIAILASAGGNVEAAMSFIVKELCSITRRFQGKCIHGVIDSGATRHCTGNRDELVNVRKIKRSVELHTACANSELATECGDLITNHVAQ